MLQIKPRHSTRPKYSECFNQLISTGFTLHIDCAVKRTELLKFLDSTEPKSEADKIHKSINQKLKQFVDFVNEDNPKANLSIQVYKHLIKDGWYFCLLLISGDFANETNRETKPSETENTNLETMGQDTELASNSNCTADISAPSEVDISVEVTKEYKIPKVSKVSRVLTPYDIEMKALYGELYVPD